jgi:hypothetical protein
MSKLKDMLKENAQYGLSSEKEDALIEMLGSLGTMAIEIDVLKRKINDYLDDVKDFPINHGLELPEEYTEAFEDYIIKLNDL